MMFETERLIIRPWNAGDAVRTEHITCITKEQWMTSFSFW